MKKLVLIAVVAVLVLTFSAGVVLAAKPDTAGPAAKATGGVGYYEGIADTGIFLVHDTFVAQATGDGYGRGNIQQWTTSDPAGDRMQRCDVEYVNVRDNIAWIAAQCTYDSAGEHEGQWLVVKVIDVGEPGANNDQIGWEWYSDGDTAAAVVMSGSFAPEMRTIDIGNLQVHRGYDGGSQPPG